MTRTKLTKEECSKGGENAAPWRPHSSCSTGYNLGVKSGQTRRARADAVPVKGYNDDCTCMRVGGYHDVLCREYKFKPMEGW